MSSQENETRSLGERIKSKLLFWSLWIVATGIAASVRYRVINMDRFNEVASGKGGLVLLWHGSTILPIYYCRNRGLYSIVSLSKDGELQNSHLQSRGFKTIRGSSKRGGARALLEAVKVLRRGGAIAITPDGPRGPVNRVQAGVVHMARHSNCVILPMGVACKPSKRAEKSWDKFLIPMPFSKAVLYFGDYLEVGDADDDTAARLIEDAINLAQQRAAEELG